MPYFVDSKQCTKGLTDVYLPQPVKTSADYQAMKDDASDIVLVSLASLSFDVRLLIMIPVAESSRRPLTANQMMRTISFMSDTLSKKMEIYLS